MGLLLALSLLAAGRIVRQRLLVGPDGAWRQELWLDGQLEAAAASEDPAAATPAPAAVTADVAMDPSPAGPGPVNDAARAAVAAPAAAKAAKSRPAAGGKRPPSPLDPNTASLDSLQMLPGVGPVLAARIVAAREGGLAFRSPADLLAVKGIGPASLSRLGPFLRFPAGPAPAPPTPLEGHNPH